MAPYDSGWNRPIAWNRYDRGYGPAGPPRSGFGRGAAGGAFRGGYPGDFRPHPGWGGGTAEAGPGWAQGFVGDGAPWDENESVFGPARYGLGPYHQRLRNRPRPDEELREEVEEALFYDTWVDAEAITVEVEEGVVTLRGELPDYDEVRYATDDAWDVEGVRGVRSELTVNPSKRPPVDYVGYERRGQGDR